MDDSPVKLRRGERPVLEASMSGKRRREAPILSERQDVSLKFKLKFIEIQRRLRGFK